MKLHRNVKKTPSSRLLLVRRLLYEGWSYAEAAQGLAVSVRTSRSGCGGLGMVASLRLKMPHRARRPGASDVARCGGADPDRS